MTEKGKKMNNKEEIKKIFLSLQNEIIFMLSILFIPFNIAGIVEYHTEREVGNSPLALLELMYHVIFGGLWFWILIIAIVDVITGRIESNKEKKNAEKDEL